MIGEFLKIKIRSYGTELRKTYFRYLPRYFDFIYSTLKKNKHGVRNPYDNRHSFTAHHFQPKDKKYKGFVIDLEQHPGFIFFMRSSDDGYCVEKKIFVYRFYEPYEDYKERGGEIENDKDLFLFAEYSYNNVSNEGVDGSPSRRTLDFFKKMESVPESVPWQVYPRIEYKEYTQGRRPTTHNFGEDRVEFKEQAGVFSECNCVISNLSEEYGIDIPDNFWPPEKKR